MELVYQNTSMRDILDFTSFLIISYFVLSKHFPAPIFSRVHFFAAIFLVPKFFQSEFFPVPLAKFRIIWLIDMIIDMVNTPLLDPNMFLAED